MQLLERELGWVRVLDPATARQGWIYEKHVVAKEGPAGIETGTAPRPETALANDADLAAAPPSDVPVARKLALLTRPALVALPKKLFVWSDWSAIEARITPWLAASPGAKKVLDIFRANDADATRPDIYTIAAADVLHKDPMR